MVMPSSPQPCDRATAWSSSAVSDNVTYRTDSPAWAPARRYCIAKVVLPEPGTPSTRYRRRRTRPPAKMLSRPAMPVDACAGSFTRDESMTYLLLLGISAADERLSTKRGHAGIEAFQSRCDRPRI